MTCENQHLTCNPEVTIAHEGVMIRIEHVGLDAFLTHCIFLLRKISLLDCSVYLCVIPFSTEEYGTTPK